MLEAVVAGLFHGFGVGTAIGYGFEWRPRYVLPLLVVLLLVSSLGAIATASLTPGPARFDLAYTLPLALGSFIGTFIGINLRRAQVARTTSASEAWYDE